MLIENTRRLIYGDLPALRWLTCMPPKRIYTDTSIIIYQYNVLRTRINMLNECTESKLLPSCVQQAHNIV